LRLATLLLCQKTIQKTPILNLVTTKVNTHHELIHCHKSSPTPGLLTQLLQLLMLTKSQTAR